MLRFTDAAGEQHPISSYEEFKIKHVMDGCDTMSFEMDTRDPIYPIIHEECRVETADNLWLIKQIDDDEIACELDFDFLKTRIYLQYRSETRSLTEVLEDHLPATRNTPRRSAASSIRCGETRFSNSRHPSSP